MLIRLSRYIILGLIISLVAFLVTQNNKEKVKKETLLLIGMISALIIFAISFRVEFYENTVPNVGEKQEPLVPQEKPKEVVPSQSEITEEAVPVSKESKKLPKTKEAKKIVDTVTNPKQDDELIVQTEPKENRLSMQYEGAIEDVIKEKIREQLYSDEVIKRRKESDYVIMPVSEWSLPLERRQFKCIPREEEEKEPCKCGPGEGTGFWGGSFLKIKGAKELPPKPKKKIELI